MTKHVGGSTVTFMSYPQPVALFERHTELMASADLEGLRRLYTSSAYYYDPLGGKLIGSEQIAPYLVSIGDYFDALSVVVTQAWTFNERAAIEWQETTTRDGEEQLQRGVCMLVARDGMIAEHRDYFALGRADWAEDIRHHLVLPASAEHSDTSGYDAGL